MFGILPVVFSKSELKYRFCENSALLNKPRDVVGRSGKFVAQDHAAALARVSSQNLRADPALGSRLLDGVTGPVNSS